MNQEGAGQGADLIGESRGKQQVLPLLRDQRDDAFDIVYEAHVKHAIGFVEYQHFDARKVDISLLCVIEQTAGCRDEDVDAVSERRNLRVHPDPAKNDE